MEECKVCGAKVAVTYDGRCTSCMSLESIEVGQAEIDYIDSLYELVNTPLADGELLRMFRDGKITDDGDIKMTAVDSIINRLATTNKDIRLFRTPIAQLYNKYKEQLDSGEYNIETLANYGNTVGGQVVETRYGIVIYKDIEYYDDDEDSGQLDPFEED